MQPILWIVLALGVAFVWSYIVVLRTQRMLPRITMPTGEAMPTTALQRLAWQALIPTLGFTLMAFGLAAYHGVVAVWDNDSVRLTVTALRIAALGGYTDAIFWSLLIVSILASLAGILIGYRRS